jgi:hypothetical protein
VYSHTGIERGSTLAPLLNTISPNKRYTNKNGKVITLEYNPQDKCNYVYDDQHTLFSYPADHLPIIFTCTPFSFLVVDDITENNIFIQIFYPCLPYVKDIEYTQKRKIVILKDYNTSYTITNEGQQKREYIDYLVLRAFSHTTHFTLDFEFQADDVPDRFIVEYPAGNILYDSKWLGNRQYVESQPHLYPEGWGGYGVQHKSFYIPFNPRHSHVVVKTYAKESSGWYYKISCTPHYNKNINTYYSIPITLYNVYQSTEDALYVGTYFNTYNLYSLHNEISGVFHINPKNCMVNHDILYLNDTPYQYKNKIISAIYYPNTFGSIMEQNLPNLIQYDHTQNYNQLTPVKTLKTCISSLPDYYFHFYNFSRLYYYNHLSTLFSNSFYQSLSLHTLHQNEPFSPTELPFTLYIDNKPISVYLVDTLTIDYLKDKEIRLEFTQAVKDFRILPYLQSPDTLLYRSYIDVGESVILTLPDTPIPYDHPISGLQISYFGG